MWILSTQTHRGQPISRVSCHCAFRKGHLMCYYQSAQRTAVAVWVLDLCLSGGRHQHNSVWGHSVLSHIPYKHIAAGVPTNWTHLSRWCQSAIHVKQTEDVSVRREAVWVLHFFFSVGLFWFSPLQVANDTGPLETRLKRVYTRAFFPPCSHFSLRVCGPVVSARLGSTRLREVVQARRAERVEFHLQHCYSTGSQSQPGLTSSGRRVDSILQSTADMLPLNEAIDGTQAGTAILFRQGLLT